MATVTSFTAERILEMVAGWQDVAHDQQELNARIAALSDILVAHDQQMTDLNNQIIPQLQAALAANQDELSNLNDIVLAGLDASLSANTLLLNQVNEVDIPALESGLTANEENLTNLNEVTLPALEVTLEENAQVLAEIRDVTIPELEVKVDQGIQDAHLRPQQYFATSAPSNPDADGRPLQVGDVWYDTDDGHKTYKWTGAEWTTFNINVADFSLTARKFLSTSHLIY